jgi:hypothetical protein
VILNREDILAAVRIRKLRDHAEENGSTEEEAAAYRDKAQQFADRYRFGDQMRDDV